MSGIKTKIYDEASKKWVTVSSSDASGMELVNPGYVDEQGNSVSVDNAFTKVDNRLYKLEEGQAWIVHNMGVGGGGGGGTGPDTEYTITIHEGETVYTTGTSATINITINSAGIKKAFTVLAKDVKTGKTLGTWKKYSMTKSDITINGLIDRNEIEISAYDAKDIYATPKYVTIISGAIKLEIQKIPNKTIYIGGTNEVPMNFTITNNIINSPAAFTLKMNGDIISSLDNINTITYSVNYDARKLIFPEGSNPQAGSKFIFEAEASTVLNGDPLTSNKIKFDITVADANKLIIVTEGISETNTPVDQITSFNQGTSVSFIYYLSCGLTKYQTFNLDYTVYSVINGVETQIDYAEIKNINKGISQPLIYSKADIPTSTGDNYYKISMYSYAVNDPGDSAAQDTKEVYFRISEAVTKDLYANNTQKALLAYFSKVSGFPNNSVGTWNYKPRTSGEFEYVGTMKETFKEGVNLTLYRVNGSTSGYLPDIDINNPSVAKNQIPAIRLEGEAYGELFVGPQFFPDIEIGEGFGIFQNTGFNMSMTFKADKSSNAKEVLFSLGKYREDILYTGIEISLEQIEVKVGVAATLIVPIPQNELLTVDIDVFPNEKKEWYFRIYLNGTLSKSAKVKQSDIDWRFSENIFLGCRNDNGNRSRFSNCNIYDLKLYTSSLGDAYIVQNAISAVEQARLIKGIVDPNLDAELRTKNYFTPDGTCMLWDYTTNGGKGSFIEGPNMLNKLKQLDIPYPIVIIKETSSSPTLFEPYSSAVFPEDQKDEIMSKHFPISIEYYQNGKSLFLNTPVGVDATKGLRVSLQGTSSLSYVAKNFEIYMGDADETGKPLLFQPKDEWLPENRFTLKADVMDSSHVNNVFIGKVINGEIPNQLTGEPFKPFSPTPPMTLYDSYFESPEMATHIKSRIRHTSDGFPCLLFIQYAPGLDGVPKMPKFCGIYNFNLGRYAYFNLGLKILTTYTKQSPDGPSIVSDYKENEVVWNSTNNEGMYSLEINKHSSAQGGFQQDDMKIIQYMADTIYTSTDKATAYNKAKEFYNQMANMALTRIQKYTMGDSNQMDVPIPGEFYDLNKNEYYNFSQCDKFLHWNNACAYFVIGMIFGLVDNMCKNLTIRNWGGQQWYTCFYDLDSGFKLNNAGQNVVAYFAHLHRWFNTVNKAGVTDFAVQKNYPTDNINGIQQYYAIFWGRIWEILENLPGIDSGEIGERPTLETVYKTFRETLFRDPEEFITTHYKGYTDQTGSLLFNYDFNIKYLSIAKTYNPNTGEYEDTTKFDQMQFLHGNRVLEVKDWFLRRIHFLDSVYGYKDGKALLDNVKSPILSKWVNNKAATIENLNRFAVELAGTSKLLYTYNYSTQGAFWIDETPVEAIVPVPTGEMVITVGANEYITHFKNFKNYAWTALNTIDFPLLEVLDLSGLKTVPSTSFFVGGVYDAANNIGLKNIKELILSNVQLTGNQASSYTLDVSNCKKLNLLDVSRSNITNINLSTSTVIKTYNLSYTDIAQLKISNQSFLTSLILEGCNNLHTIELDNCESLPTLVVPGNVQTLIIRNCPGLTDLNLHYFGASNVISPLKKVIIDNCPGLKNFTASGQNNQALEIELVGAWNLETLDLANILTDKIMLPPLRVDGKPYFKSLISLNLSGTSFNALKYNDNQNLDYLELSNFPNLSNLRIQGCSKITKVVCNNVQDNPIELESDAMTNCTGLTTLHGHYSITSQNIFRSCRSLKLNTPAIYSKYGINNFIPVTDSCNITIPTSNQSMLSVFEDCGQLSYDDFKFIMVRLHNEITSLEATFKNCYGINGALWRNMFKPCPKVTSIKDFLNSSAIGGIMRSRKSDYNLQDDSTWGILDFLPNLLDATSAFSNTSIEWIDNNLFAPINGNSLSISIINGMFSNCRSLRAAEDTNALVVTEGSLRSDNFFYNLENLVDLYPENVFLGCGNVCMDIISEGENTFLFHVRAASDESFVLNNSLYAGIKLQGEIKKNVFGGVSRSFTSNGVTYSIPKFTSINSPFSDTGTEITFNLFSNGDVFKGISGDILQLIYPFKGLKVIGEPKIPANLLEGCSKLTSARGLLADLDINNNNEVYTFPAQGFFQDCVLLEDISYILNNTNKMRIKLVGEGFKNCCLKEVGSAFTNSGVYGIIPYRLFFMVSNNRIRQTINNMDNLFFGCYYLGYDIDRELDLESSLITTGYSRLLNWNDRVIKTEGTPLTYKLNMSNLVKGPNYNIPTSDSSQLVFDEWYLDGYGYEEATSNDPSFNDFKTSIREILNYDIKQKEVVRTQNLFDRYKTCHQNYAIPTDLFRYCSSKAVLTGVLQTLFYYPNNLIKDNQTGNTELKQSTKIDGIRGRLPVKLLQDLTNNTNFDGLLHSTNFDSFVGLNSETFERGIQYPFDLLKYNTKVQNLANFAANTEISVGVDINPDLLSTLPDLKSVKGFWTNCSFDNRKYNLPSLNPEDLKFPQVPFVGLFKNNLKIVDVSDLFSVTMITDKVLGLKLIEKTLLFDNNQINTIANMFANNSSMIGAVPEFKAVSYPVLNTVLGYLTGCPKGNISNAADLEERLQPIEWKN